MVEGWSALLERLDHAPRALAAAGGGAVGLAAAGLAWAAESAPVTVVIGVVLVPAAGWMALTGRARVREERRPAPATEAPKAAELAGPRRVEDPVLGAVIEIPAGAFWMGSPDGVGHGDERPRHRVRLSAYAIGETPVTRRQWAAVMGGEAPGVGELDAPVNQVSWFDALRFCNAASLREGLTPCYVEVEEGRWAWRREADGYRLPTEAEWEHACRAGTETLWWCGDDEAGLAEVAWYDEGARGSPREVRGKRPNPWGLYDVHGNVWEWCWDVYDASAYARRVGEAEVLDPVSEGGDGVDTVVNTDRVARGGSFWITAELSRSADRYWWNPGIEIRFLGFRCVRAPRRQL